MTHSQVSQPAHSESSQQSASSQWVIKFIISQLSAYSESTDTFTASQVNNQTNWQWVRSQQTNSQCVICQQSNSEWVRSQQSDKLTVSQKSTIRQSHSASDVNNQTQWTRSQQLHKLTVSQKSTTTQTHSKSEVNNQINHMSKAKSQAKSDVNNETHSESEVKNQPSSENPVNCQSLRIVAKTNPWRLR